MVAMRLSYVLPMDVLRTFSRKPAALIRHSRGGAAGRGDPWTAGVYS
jgi:hypothetical protein